MSSLLFWKQLTIRRTPWLTTRRRTCPICKNDVVRSLTSSATPHAVPSSMTTTPTANSDEVQNTAAVTTNESPSAAIPIPRDSTSTSEVHDELAATLVNSQSNQGGWAGLSLSALSGEAAWGQEQADRNR